MNSDPAAGKAVFTTYELFIVILLAVMQFTVILDFMVLSPLGAQLLKELHVSPSQFTIVVSAYAFSAGVSGLLAAGFADKFDRKKLLLFFYSGFIIGTLLCGIAPDYEFLLMARIVTGIFGGVMGSIGFAIITDLFRLDMRGRVMGIVQMAFAASQVLGLPVGLYLAGKWDWHAPFLLIVGVSLVTMLAIAIKMKPITAHLALQSERNAFRHLGSIIFRGDYLRGFAATVLLATGGFMLMPLGSAFAVNNLGISIDHLPMIYLVTGIFSMVAGPLVGYLADKFGKYPVFFIGSVASMIIVVFYCSLDITPLIEVVVLNVLLFISITSRIVSSSALMSAVPDMKDRGGFMSVNSSVQYIAGGVASVGAGRIVLQQPSGKLIHYEVLGYVVAAATLFTIVMMYFIDQYVKRKVKSKVV